MRDDRVKGKFTGILSGIIIFGCLLMGGGSDQVVFGQTRTKQLEPGPPAMMLESVRGESGHKANPSPEHKQKYKHKSKVKPKYKQKHKHKSGNYSPEIISLPPESTLTGYPYLYQAVAVDADGDPLHWSLQVSPTGMLIDPDSGLIAAASLPAGQHTVSLRVDDGQGGSATQDFTIQLQAGPIILSSPPDYTYKGTPYRYDLDAMEPSALDLHYAITSGPAGSRIDPDSGLFEWDANSAGVFEIQLMASNPAGQTATQSYSLTVLDPDGVRIISTPESEAYVSVLYEYPLALLNAPGAGATFYFNQAPIGMTIDAVTGRISWTPAGAGIFAVEVVVRNDHGYTDTQQFSLVVHSLEQMDQMFGGMLSNMFISLGNADLAGAMNLLTVDAQLRLGPLFNELLDDMDQIAANYTDPVRVSINPDMAEYMVRRTGGNGDRVFMVTFLRNNNQEWKINDL
jgi:hypothetical protein